jgi:hypothetical protein
MKRIAICVHCMLALFYLACNKSNDLPSQAPKTVLQVRSVSTVPSVSYPQETVDMKLSIARPEKITLTKIVVSLNDQELTSSDIAAGTDSIQFNYSYTIRDAEVGNSLLFVVQAFDQDGIGYLAKEYTVYVMSTRAKIDINIPATAPAEVLAGETVQFDVDIHSDISLRSIRTFLNNEELTSLRKENFTDPYHDAYQFSYETKDADVGTPLEFVLEVMDTEGNVIRSDVYLLQVNRAHELDISEFFDVKWGAQNCTEAGHFLNTTTGEVYELAGVAAKSAGVDLVVFYSGSSNAYNVTSPTFANVINIIYNKTDDMMANWPVRNTTKIKMVTSITPADFAAITSYSEIKDLYDGAGAESETTIGLIDGRMFVFKTSAEKYGIVLVKSRSQNNNRGYMTVDLKVQK